MAFEQGQESMYWKTPPPPPGGKNISRAHLREKIRKVEEKKGQNVKYKKERGKEKGRKGKEKDIRGSKWVK